MCDFARNTLSQSQIYPCDYTGSTLPFFLGGGEWNLTVALQESPRGIIFASPIQKQLFWWEWWDPHMQDQEDPSAILVLLWSFPTLQSKSCLERLQERCRKPRSWMGAQRCCWEAEKNNVLPNNSVKFDTYVQVPYFFSLRLRFSCKT